ncbi:hypothetical protein LJC63_01825 [Ruminococcaceae bacterium OttesenSCG-928-L11]|nr:hypothetical protein [Ruminococcaceae bacterium OttesenSCG-928-L11]
MKHCTYRILPVILSLALVLAMTGCSGSGSGTAHAETQKRLDELVQDYVNELEGLIIPLKEKPEELSENGITVSAQGATYNADALREFYNEYGERKSGMVTFVFTTSTSFVVTRLVFEAGFGYYMRYQHNAKAEGDLPITNRFIDNVVLEEQDDRILLRIYNEKKEVASFTFRNIIVAVEEETAEPIVIVKD